MNTLTIKDAIDNKSLNKLVDKVIVDKNQALKLVGNIASVVISNPGLSKCTAQSIVGASIIAQSLNRMCIKNNIQISLFEGELNYEIND